MTQAAEMPVNSRFFSHVNSAVDGSKVYFRSTVKPVNASRSTLPERRHFGAESQSATCPCCGAELKNQQPRIDLNSNNFLFRGHTLALSPKQAELMDSLIRRAPGIVTHDTLIRLLWGSADEPLDPRKNIMVHVCRLRSLLSPFGVSIINVLDVGYRLHVEGEA